MEVADIVRVVNEKGSVPNVVLHGKVRGIVKQPNEFSSIKSYKGNWAVLDVYAITCLRENLFGSSESTLLTPQGSILFILEDEELVGKLVSVYGKTKTIGVDLRRQNSFSKTAGYHALVFKKAKMGGWYVIPNIVEEFTKTSSKDITNYLKQCSEVGFKYLDFTKEFLPFKGSEDYEFLPSGVSSLVDGLSFTTDLSPKFNLKDYEGLQDKLRVANKKRWSSLSGSGLSLVGHSTLVEFRKVLSNAISDSKRVERIVPNTTIRFNSVITEYSVNGYSYFLDDLLNTKLVELRVDNLDLFLLNCPHLLYLQGYISFDVAEKVSYVSSRLLKQHYSEYKDTFYRNVSLLFEGCQRSYLANGTTYFLNSLASKPICKVSEKLQNNFKVTNSPLSKEELAVVNVLIRETLDYSSFVTDGMYYTAEHFDLALQDAENLGMVVSVGSYYMPYNLAEKEVSVISRFLELGSKSLDYGEDTVLQCIDELENHGSTFSREQKYSILNLNSNFGIFMGVSKDLYPVEELVSLVAKEEKFFSKIYVVTSGWSCLSPLQGRGNVIHIPLEALRGTVLDTYSLVLVEQAHLFSLDDFATLEDAIDSNSAVYLFGNPWTGTNYFRTLCSSMQRVLVTSKLDELPQDGISLNNNGSYLDFLKDTKVAYKEVGKIDTLPVLQKMINYAFDNGYYWDDLVVVSDLGKSLSANVVKSKIRCSKDLLDNLVYIPYGTYGVSKGREKFDWTGDYISRIVDEVGDIAIISLGNSGYFAEVPTSKLKPATCVPSRLQELEPRDIVFYLNQEDYGNIYKEDVLRALEHTSGISFVGKKSLISDLRFSSNSLRSTLLRRISGCR